MTTNLEVIEGLEKMEEVEPSDKVWMFVQLCDHQQLIAELKKQAMLENIGIVPQSVLHGFAYAVLRLAKPHLFEENQNECI